MRRQKLAEDADKKKNRWLAKKRGAAANKALHFFSLKKYHLLGRRERAIFLLLLPAVPTAKPLAPPLCSFACPSEFCYALLLLLALVVLPPLLLAACVRPAFLLLITTMSRYASQGGSAVAANVLQTIAAREANYKEPIKQNHGLCKTAASRLVDAEKGMMKFLETDTSSIIGEEEIAAFFQEQKEILKAEAAKNVERERHVESFVSGVKSVRNDLINAAGSQGEEEEESVNLPDYNAKIKDAMSNHSSSVSRVPVQQEPLYQQVVEALGENVASKKNTGDDDDIEITETQNASSSLKCPITGKLIEDAVKNKLCKHVYSREGITAHIHSSGSGGRAKCPAAGCSNTTVTMDQLEDDYETSRHVSRQKRREDFESQQRASQAASDLMDSDEE